MENKPNVLIILVVRYMHYWYYHTNIVHLKFSILKTQCMSDIFVQQWITECSAPYHMEDQCFII